MSEPNKPKVILTEYLDDEPAQWLAERTNLVRQSREDLDALKRELADAEGLAIRTYTTVDEELLAAAPKLKVVGRAGVGLENVDLEACRQRGVRVVYTPESNSQAVVEYVFALALDAIRPRFYLNEKVDRETFYELRKQNVGQQLDTMVLGVLGMGRIGRRIAQVGHAIGMRVLYNDLLTRRELGLPDDEPSEFVDKPTLWAESDVLTLHVDGRKENRDLIDADVLGQLKGTCLLINAARGMVIDIDALADWARKVVGAGGHAVLDVHNPEPPPDDYPLFGMPNVKLLPHLGSRTEPATLNMSWVVRDIVRVLNGEEPQYAAT